MRFFTLPPSAPTHRWSSRSAALHRSTAPHRAQPPRPTARSHRAPPRAESRRVLVASPSYLKRHPAPKTPDDLRHHQCLLHGDANASTVWRFGTTTARGVPVPVRGRFAANNSEAVALLARQGLGIALLADWLVKDDLARGRLVPLLTTFATPPAPVFALSPPGRFSSLTVRALTDHLAATLAARLTAEP